MKWLKLSNQTSLDPKLRMVAHELSMPFGNVYATWVCLLERASQVSYAGRFCEYCNDEFKSELSFQLGYPKSDLEKILSAFNGKLINQNTIKNWERHQIDPTNKSRQLKYREKSTQSNGNNSVSLLCNGVTVEESRVEEIREERKDKEKNTKKENLFSLKTKSTLDTWENSFGKFSIEHISAWIAENNLDPEKVKNQIEPFRLSCEAKGYKYQSFPAAFKKWGCEKEKCKKIGGRDDRDKWRC